MRPLPLGALLLSVFAFTTFAGCGGGGGGSGSPTAPVPPIGPAKQGKYFTHVVVLIQENRSFDNLFATFPGADGARSGLMKVLLHGQYVAKRIKLTRHSLIMDSDLTHCHAAFETAYDDGKMDGFNLEHLGTCGAQAYAGRVPYQYVDPAEIRPYWDLAKQYVLADHLFQTQGSGSFIAHQDLIRGGTAVNGSASLIDNPTAFPWGCDAPANTVTSLITTTGEYLKDRGPYPCLSYHTLRDLLDADQVSWRYYTPAIGQNVAGDLFNAFDVIHDVRYGPEWSRNVVWPESTILNDIANGTLPAVSWVVPNYHNSDHPGNKSNTGPSWVASVVNAIGKSPAWRSTAIVIVWDDWGGLYDHLAPPFKDNQGGLGLRVPAIVVSPFAKRGYITHRVYEFGSLVRLIEDNWNLGRLGTTDGRSASLLNDAFDFAQKARPYSSLTTPFSQEYFERQPASNHAVDDE